MKDTTLLFLRRGDEVLLAMKKRGFGAGKWNAPGGKVEADETPELAAIRETQEEVGVTPRHLRLLGAIDFFMPGLPGFDGHRIFIYATTEWEGEPAETEEMRPKWFHAKDIPYDDMWPADRRWLPDALAGTYAYFTGRIVQGAGDHIDEHDIHKAPAPAVIQ